MTAFTNSLINYAVCTHSEKLYFALIGESGDTIATVERWNDAHPLFTAEAEGNARLLTAAWNAFQSAAESLGTNAVEFANYCRNGKLADLVTELRHTMGFLLDLRDYDDHASTKRPHPAPLAERLKHIEAILEAVQPTIKRYTVMLLYPDDLRDGAETYLACVEARTPEQAVAVARDTAVEAMFIDEEYRAEVHENFALLGVFAGHVACVLDGQDL